MKTTFSLYHIVIYILTFAIPILVLPSHVDNAFNTPKTVLLLLGVAVLTGMYGIRFLAGRPIRVLEDHVPKVLVMVLLLNFFNFLYTQNIYFSIVAVSLNLACLGFFYFVALNTDGRHAWVLLVLSAGSGLVVCVITYFQFFGHFLIFKWAHKGIMVMGTIGNSNYLGAYLIFPLFAMIGLLLLSRGWLRYLVSALLLFMIGAFLFTRARAGWFGFFLSLPLLGWMMMRIHHFSPIRYVRTHPRRIVTALAAAAVVLATLWFAAPDRLHNMMRFKQVTRSDTLQLRIEKYYTASWWLFKQSPLYGTGLWSFRNQVYWAQAEINKQDPGYFKNYPEPKPRRVHTEFLEILNDGGLVAAAVLALFFLMVMRHGWRVIRDEEIVIRDRTIAATAFSSLVAIMLSSIFFFSFRINSTLFMTVLMMGLLEGLYVHHYGLLRTRPGWHGASGRVLIPVAVLILVGFVWFTGIKPFKGEMAHYQYKRALQKGNPKAAEQHLLEAIEYDPRNTAYCLYAAQLYMNTIRDFTKANNFIDRAILDYNGDITRWSLFYFKGLLKFQSGSLFEAREAFERAIYFNPEFQPAHQKLGEVNQVIKDHDRVMIKFR